MYIISCIPEFVSNIIQWLKANPVRSALSLIHALWLLGLTFIWLSQSYTYGDEFLLVQMTSGIRHIVLESEKPAKDGFLFINVAYDRELIPKLDADGFEMGNQDITDRKKLAQFFHILNQNATPHRFVLCDIFFEGDSPHDDLLLEELRRMRNIIIPFHQSNSGQWDIPKFPVQSGLADYITADTKGSFLKFRLMEDIYKSIPLIMYETLHHAEFRKTPFGYAMNGKYSLNSIVLDFRIRNSDLFQGTEGYPSAHLGELLRMSETEIQEMVRNRIVIIGDFKEEDIHGSVFGDIPGALILLNAYLALVSGDKIISAHFLIFLSVIYLIISYNIFYGKRIEEHQWIIRIIRSVIRGRFIANLLNYLLIMGAVSVFSYFIFNIHINILLIAAYLTVLGHIIRYVRERREASYP